MTTKTQKVKSWLVDIGEHVAGSFNWTKLAFIVILFVISITGYILIKNE